MNCKNVENVDKKISLINLKNNHNSLEDLVYFEYYISKMNKEDLEEDLFVREHHKTIQKLNSSHNLFTEITPCFLKLENLKNLNMAYNNISKIVNLKNCVNLEILNLSHNQIKNPGNSLTLLKKLQHLDLSFNHLYIHDTFIILFTLNPILNSLCLEGNENYDFDKIKFKCLETLKNLELLDNIKIYSNRKLIKNLKCKNISVVQMKTITGEKKEIKTLSEYIKFKKKDLVENKKQFDKLEKIYEEKKLKNEIKSKNEFLSSYYFNMLNFGK